MDPAPPHFGVLRPMPGLILVCWGLCWASVVVRWGLRWASFWCVGAYAGPHFGVPGPMLGLIMVCWAYHGRTEAVITSPGMRAKATTQ